MSRDCVGSERPLFEGFRACWCAALAVLLVVVTVPGQTMTERKAAAAANAVAAALADDSADGASAAAVKSLKQLLDALGSAVEREVAKVVLDIVAASGDGPILIKSDDAGVLLAAVKKHRPRGYPDRLLPALLLLESRDPEDPRVVFALAEARAIASATFDAKAAAAGFGKLLETLREGSDAGGDPAARMKLLKDFLPELAVTPLLSKRERGELTFWFRRTLLGYQDSLEKGDPIPLGQLAEPRLMAVQELLDDARRRLDQPKCKKLLDAMLRMQPNNPVLHYGLFEVHASMGAANDTKRAIKHLDEFLLRTDPDLVEGARGEVLGALPMQEVERDLFRYRPARPEGQLVEQRARALEYRELLDAKKVKPMFLSPNRTHIEKHRRKLIRESNRSRKRKAELEGKIARNEAGLARVRVANVNLGDKATRINRFLAALRDQKSKLRGYMKLLAPYDEALAQIDQLLKVAKEQKKAKR